MTDEEHPTADEARGEARGAELRENLAMTDARRAEEETAKAQEEAEKAAKEAEKRAEEEQRERERAARVHAEAEQARERADAAVQETGGATTLSGAAVASPGVGTRTDPDSVAAVAAGSTAGGIPALDRLPPAAQRPEVLVGAAFGGAFIVARILKRIFD